jgi:hypothetical protein
MLLYTHLNQQPTNSPPDSKPVNTPELQNVLLHQGKGE